MAANKNGPSRPWNSSSAVIHTLGSLLEGEGCTGQGSKGRLAREHADVAGAPAGAEAGAGLGSGAGERGGKHGLRGRTGGSRTPGGTPPDRNTHLGILSYAELALLRGERVLACEEAIVTGAFAGQPLDAQVLLEFHHRISGDVVSIAFRQQRQKRWREGDSRGDAAMRPGEDDGPLGGRRLMRCPVCWVAETLKGGPAPKTFRS